MYILYNDWVQSNTLPHIRVYSTRMEKHWVTRVQPTRVALANMNVRDIPYSCRRYIRDQYATDIQKCIYDAISRVHDSLESEESNSQKLPCVVVNIDAFLHRPELSHYTYTAHKHHKELYDLYIELAKYSMGAPLPFMLMFYEYLTQHNISVVFIYNRAHKHRKFTKLNLSLFNVYDYALLLRPTHIEKKNFITECITRVGNGFNIIAILDTLPHEHPGDIVLPSLMR